MMKRVFIITGTRKGIGKQLAEHYLDRDNAVAGCSRGESSIKHKNYRHFQLDVSDEEAVIKVVRNVNKEFGRVDVLLNNAGTASMNHILTTSCASVKKIIDTNFTGTFLFSREAGKSMMKNQKGRIINFSSVASTLHLEGEAIYAASKSAIENLTQTMAKETAEFGITVNAIGIAPVKTDMIKEIPKDKIDALINQQSVKRYSTIEDIINLIDFFISEKSDFVTGQIIYQGGITR